MLPKILDIAEENGLTFDPRNYGKKETLCKCPFCLEDSKPDKKKKYYLSLNTQDQVYKCWFCGVKGGVLDFESRLTGLPYQLVREKYYGEKRSFIHPAEQLNPNQLNLIGWKEYKQKNKKDFKQKREVVLQDWKKYEYNQLVELFAELMIIGHIENQIERQKDLISYLKNRCEKSQIHSCYSRLFEEYKKPEHVRAEWAKEGVKIARIAWKISLSELDFELKKVVLLVPFIHYLLMQEKELHKSNSRIV